MSQVQHLCSSCTPRWRRSSARVSASEWMLQIGMPMSHIARIVSSSFLLLCVACPSGKPPPPAEPAYQPAFKDVRIRWTEPQCFGYAADKDAFACLDFAMRTDSAGPEEPEPIDFSKE